MGKLISSGFRLLLRASSLPRSLRTGWEGRLTRKHSTTCSSTCVLIASPSLGKEENTRRWLWTLPSLRKRSLLRNQKKSMQISGDFSGPACCSGGKMILIVDLSWKARSLSRDEFVGPVARIVPGAGQEWREVHFSALSSEDIQSASGIILCGTALKDNFFAEKAEEFAWLRDVRVPVLGICAGCRRSVSFMAAFSAWPARSG